MWKLHESEHPLAGPVLLLCVDICSSCFSPLFKPSAMLWRGNAIDESDPWVCFELVALRAWRQRTHVWELAQPGNARFQVKTLKSKLHTWSSGWRWLQPTLEEAWWCITFPQMKPGDASDRAGANEHPWQWRSLAGGCSYWRLMSQRGLCTSQHCFRNEPVLFLEMGDWSSFSGLACFTSVRYKPHCPEHTELAQRGVGLAGGHPPGDFFSPHTTYGWVVVAQKNP